MPLKSPVPDNVKKFLREIGSKGGKKSGQHPQRSELNRAAAIARWRGEAPKVKSPEK